MSVKGAEWFGPLVRYNFCNWCSMATMTLERTVAVVKELFRDAVGTPPGSVLDGMCERIDREAPDGMRFILNYSRTQFIVSKTGHYFSVHGPSGNLLTIVKHSANVVSYLKRVVG